MDPSVNVVREGKIARVILNRPARFNAFDLEMVGQFAASMVELATDAVIRGVVITGAGKAFCAGGDLRWASSFPQGPAAAFHQLASRFHDAILEIRRMRKPVVAAVNGVAAGGGFSIALACDFRVMGKSATLRQAYTDNGLCVNGGASFILPRLAGLARAMEILSSEEPIAAQRALDLGLATKVVEDGAVVEAATEMAVELSRRSVHAFGWVKHLLTDSFSTSFETHLERERAGLRSCAAHADGQEGLRAFSEKRRPFFEDKG
jgi:2-(1,2-epoxy-1,2-dihydrophenyl)acetyl-CoA isomerase